jgi:glycosyltransferase involved in cell wall biosynthesis
MWEYRKQNKMNNIAVIIPCFRVKKHIADVISRIGPEVTRIYAVDDCCPEQSGDFILENVTDPRVVVLRNSVNLGVGGAMKTGYLQALYDGIQIIVKIDGDGQMDPGLIPVFCMPLVEGRADYTKGNRFYDLSKITNMPPIRILGNALLSLMTKLSTGYWNLFDVNNGFTAVQASLLEHIPPERVSNRFFFESDMLFNLGVLRAKVLDIPMDAFYGDEVSNLKVSRIFWDFSHKHLRNFVSRIFYNYFLRDFTIASLELLIGLCLTVFGVLYGALAWWRAIDTLVPTPLGTIMLPVLSFLVGVILLLSFFNYDISNTPREPVHRLLPKRKADFHPKDQ